MKQASLILGSPLVDGIFLVQKCHLVGYLGFNSSSAVENVPKICLLSRLLKNYRQLSCNELRRHAKLFLKLKPQPLFLAIDLYHIPLARIGDGMVSYYVFICVACIYSELWGIGKSRRLDFFPR